MNSIFYSLSKIKDLNMLKTFYKEALSKATYYHVDILDCARTYARQRFPELTAEDYIENHITLATHNVCIDRFDHIDRNRFGEIGSSTFHDPSLFLFIYLSVDDLYELVDKYELKSL